MFRIYNSESGHELGVYPGVDRAAAYLAMLDDAGAYSALAAKLREEAAEAGDLDAIAIIDRGDRADVASMILDGNPDVVVVSVE